VESGALPHWTLSSLAARGTAMKRQNNQQNAKSTKVQQLFLKIRFNGRVFLRLRKVTAKMQLKADHLLTVKATKPRIQENVQE
jgi:hypothetical protein